jgi:NMT1-like family
MTVDLHLGYVPLVDAAPLIVAEALGFAEEENLDVILHPAPSWASLRDMLAQGQADAAQMLAPLPVAMALGLVRSPARFDALSILGYRNLLLNAFATLAMALTSKTQAWPDWCCSVLLISCASVCRLPFRCTLRWCTIGSAHWVQNPRSWIFAQYHHPEWPKRLRRARLTHSALANLGDQLQLK